MRTRITRRAALGAFATLLLPVHGLLAATANSRSGTLQGDLSHDAGPDAGAPAAALASEGAVDTATVNTAGVKFEPMFVYVNEGGTVNWEGMIGHNVETLGAMIPEGGTALNSQLGENISAKFDVPGIYVYKCTPHWGARMGGVIVVGTSENPGAILDAYLAAIETDKSMLPAKGLLKKVRADMESKGLV